MGTGTFATPCRSIAIPELCSLAFNNLLFAIASVPSHSADSGVRVKAAASEVEDGLRGGFRLEHNIKKRKKKLAGIEVVSSQFVMKCKFFFIRFSIDVISFLLVSLARIKIIPQLSRFVGVHL